MWQAGTVVPNGQKQCPKMPGDRQVNVGVGAGTHRQCHDQVPAQGCALSALSAARTHGSGHDTEGGTTTCPGCGTAVVVRDWYTMHRYRLDDGGACRACGTQLPGVYDGPVGHWGQRRLPVSIANVGR